MVIFHSLPEGNQAINGYGYGLKDSGPHVCWHPGKQLLQGSLSGDGLGIIWVCLKLGYPQKMVYHHTQIRQNFARIMFSNNVSYPKNGLSSWKIMFSELPVGSMWVLTSTQPPTEETVR